VTDTVLKLWGKYCWRTVLELVRPQIEDLRTELDALGIHTTGTARAHQLLQEMQDAACDGDLREAQRLCGLVRFYIKRERDWYEEPPC
jgi:hypothetical protein